MTREKLSRKNWFIITLFCFMGGIAWNTENMYFKRNAGRTARNIEYALLRSESLDIGGIHWDCFTFQQNFRNHNKHHCY